MEGPESSKPGFQLQLDQLLIRGSGRCDAEIPGKVAAESQRFELTCAGGLGGCMEHGGFLDFTIEAVADQEVLGLLIDKAMHRAEEAMAVVEIGDQVPIGLTWFQHCQGLVVSRQQPLPQAVVKFQAEFAGS